MNYPRSSPVCGFSSARAPSTTKSKPDRICLLPDMNREAVLDVYRSGQGIRGMQIAKATSVVNRPSARTWAVSCFGFPTTNDLACVPSSRMCM